MPNGLTFQADLCLNCSPINGRVMTACSAFHGFQNGPSTRSLICGARPGDQDRNGSACCLACRRSIGVGV